MTERITPGGLLDERSMLEGWLEFQRATFEAKVLGVSSELSRRRATPPSTLSLLGLLRHNADGEIVLFRGCIVGEEIDHLVSVDGEEFERLDDVDVEVALSRWRTTCDDSRRILHQVADLDQRCVANLVGSEPINVRWVLVHMIEEYARHNGHADLLREALDGATGY